MAGEIDWSAVPLMVELHGIADNDIVDFIDRLEQIRNYNQKLEEAKRG